MPTPPKVFISCTSADLHSVRELARKALLTINCFPVDQETFEPDWRKVKDMLPAKIEECQALLHIAGLRYGAEPDPASLPAGEPRRSYTQMEYHIGRQLQSERGDDHFRVYTFVLPENFSYDRIDASGRPVIPESEELHQLQQAHRNALLENDHLRYKPENDLALRAQVLALQEQVITLVREQKDIRQEVIEAHAQATKTGIEVTGVLRKGVWATLAGLVALLAVGSGIALYQRRVATSQAVASAALAEKQEATNRSIAELKAELVALKNSATAAVNTVATETAFELESAPTGDPALARQKKYSVAQAITVAELQTQLSQEGADIQLLAAKITALRRTTPAKATEAEAAELVSLDRDAQQKLGDSALAQGHYSDAVAAYSAALDLTPRMALPTLWARLQRQLGGALSDWAKRSEGPAIAPRLAKAIASYRSALEVFSRESSYQEWATTQANLASALSQQAESSSGSDHDLLLAEAANIYRSILKVFTRTSHPEEWASIQNDLAGVLATQAFVSSDPDRLFAEAAVAFRAALEVRTRESHPWAWAITQSNLATTLRGLAAAVDTPDRTRLLSEAINACLAAREVLTQKAYPEDWAMVQNSLASILIIQGSYASGSEGDRLLAEAVSSLRAALEVYTRERFPNEWASTQQNLGLALYRRASSSGPAGFGLLADAIAACRSALEVFTRESHPEGWSGAQHNLALSLREQADGSGPDSLRASILREAVAAMKASLEFRTATDDPEYNLASEAWVREVESTIRELEPASSGEPQSLVVPTTR